MKVLAGIGSFVGFLALLGILYAVGVFGTIGGAHVNAYVAKKTLNSKVTTQVFQPGNKIGSQTYFESLNATIQGYKTTIKIQKSLVKSDDSAFNETNLAGIRQQCVNAVEEYNAAAKSIGTAPFRTADLPSSIDPSLCTN